VLLLNILAASGGRRSGRCSGHASDGPRRCARPGLGPLEVAGSPRPWLLAASAGAAWSEPPLRPAAAAPATEGAGGAPRPQNNPIGIAKTNQELQGELMQLPDPG